MATRKELAIKAREQGLKQFVCTELPCAKCGGITFFTAGGGRCKDCLYEFTRAKRATSEGQEKERISRKNHMTNITPSLKTGKRNQKKIRPT